MARIGPMNVTDGNKTYQFISEAVTGKIDVRNEV